MRKARATERLPPQGQPHGPKISHVPARPSLLRHSSSYSRASTPTTEGLADIPSDILDSLRAFPLFQSAPAEFLQNIATRLRTHVFAAQDEIIQEGETAKAMYFIMRGTVNVTSKDGESVYAALKAGAFFGEIGILFNVPRTARIVATTRCLLVVLRADDLRKVLPRHPDIEKSIRYEADERWALLKKLKQRRVSTISASFTNIRESVLSLDMFRNLPDDVLHQICLSVTPQTFKPFTPIVQQGTQGTELFFILSGQVEVVDETNQKTLARLTAGQYFGELAILGLSDRRTATVRTVNAVDCLVLGQEEFRKCRELHPTIWRAIEDVAKERMNETRRDFPLLTPPRSTQPLAPSATILKTDADPLAPPPMETRVLRRSSLAPPDSSEAVQPPPTSTMAPSGADVGVVAPDSRGRAKVLRQRSTLLSSAAGNKRPRFRRGSSAVTSAEIVPRVLKAENDNTGVLPRGILEKIFMYLDLPEMMQARQICRSWSHILTASPALLPVLNLGLYNRKITDTSIGPILAFAQNRPKHVIVSNCFHLTDIGFKALSAACAPNAVTWNMASAWDISSSAIVDVAQRAKGLEEVDFGNCRRVGDAVLARVVGWEIPTVPSSPGSGGVVINTKKSTNNYVGCPKLSKINLSYCKHITDRSMMHLATHASSRLETLQLTRCTSITDAGFQAWSMTRFTRLRELILADCTFLTDSSMVFLTTAAPLLQHLDLSFCCALSDVAVEVLSLGLPRLEYLNLAFCGSAVSDASMRAIGLHLGNLRELSVRGCVRVLAPGVESVVDGCWQLQRLDVSQCRNLLSWVRGGGIGRYTEMGKRVEFVL
ncbi:hypothetical protein YB2330_005896 [Saitoella coloradoensis]